MATMEELKIMLKESEQKAIRKSKELTLLIPQVLSGIVFALNHRDVLYSNTPKPENFRPEDYFCNTRIIGSVSICKEKTQQIFEHIFNGLEVEKMPVMCFNPRHGFRVMLENRVVDFLICFECDSMYVFDLGDTFELPSPVRTPYLLLNQILHENGIPVIP